MCEQKCQNCHWFRAKEPNQQGAVTSGYCMFKVRTCAHLRPGDPNSRRLVVMPQVAADHVCEHYFPDDVATKIFAIKS